MTHDGMSHPVVSVLMTAYNREPYIAEAIESVLASRFTDFELIVVDDCSTDRTVEIARRYTNDPRVRVLVNKKNLGDYPNRNRAASFAQGKYLKYVDSDDVLRSHGLEVMVVALEKFPESGFGLERPDLPGQPYPVAVSPAESYREHFLGNGLFGCGPSGALMRASSFRAVGGFRELRMVGDIDMWLRLGARYPTVKFTHGLVWWRSHENQEINAQTTSTMTAGLRVQLDALTDVACPLTAAERNEALRRVRWGFARSVWHHALRQGRPGFAAKMFRASALTGFQLFRALFPLQPKDVR